MGSEWSNSVRVGLVLGMVLVGAGSARAVEETAKSPPVESPPQTVKPQQAEETVRAQLDGTRWMLQLTPLAGGEKAKSQKDTVTFDAKQISSERLTKAGFPASNYTLTIGDDGVAVWETMQTKEGEGVAFWRGELHGATMRGVLSKHPADGTPEDFSFTGQESGGMSSSPTSPTSAQGTSAATETPTKKSKKKRSDR